MNTTNKSNINMFFNNLKTQNMKVITFEIRAMVSETKTFADQLPSQVKSEARTTTAVTPSIATRSFEISSE